MSKTYEFLRECGVSFVATIDGDAPAARPFGAVMEYGGELYLSTANTKDVYTQLIGNRHVQIVALKTGTREWIRIAGKAVETHDLEIKRAMLEACPVLSRRFASEDCENFALFKVTEMKSLLYASDGVREMR